MSIRRAALAGVGALVLSAALLAAPPPANASTAVVAIAAESGQAVDSATADAVCRLVRRVHGGDCIVEATRSPRESVALLRDGDVPFAILPADVASFAHRGADDYAEIGPFEGLRTAVALYAEKLTVLAADGAGIRTVEELAGSRIAVAGPERGRASLFETIKEIKDWSRGSFGTLDRLRPDDWNAALCNGRIDAVVAPIVHPDLRIKAMTTACPLRIVAVTGQEVDYALADGPYWRRTEIPRMLYLGSEETIETVGIPVVLATSAEVPGDVVGRVVSAVVGNMDRFRKLHPALGRLVRGDLFVEDPVVPYHPGVERYRTGRGGS